MQTPCVEILRASDHRVTSGVGIRGRDQREIPCHHERVQLMLLESHGELVSGKSGYSDEVCDELLTMSPATIDRYLAPARAKDPLRGITATTSEPLLRNSITVRKAGD
ncbi:MAG: hypothetical protein ACTHZM_02970 [Canibacter sp.]